jgi:hypothetical protein
MEDGSLKRSNSALLIVALYLILMGILFAALMLTPGVSLNTAWPIVFVVFGITLFLPAFIWPYSRGGLAVLFVQVGGWSRGVATFGLGIFVLSAVAYGLFAALMGEIFMKALGAGLVVLSGILIFAASFRKPAQDPAEILPDDDQVPPAEVPGISDSEEA